MQLAEAKKLKGEVMTRSLLAAGMASALSPIPAAASASQSASVPLAHPMACGAAQAMAAARSKEATSGPRMKRCEAQTSSMAAMTSSRMAENWRWKSRKGTGLSAEEAEVKDTELSYLGMTFE